MVLHRTQVIGMVFIAFPIMTACIIVRFVMADMDPFGYFNVVGDLKHTSTIDDDVSPECSPCQPHRSLLNC